MATRDFQRMECKGDKQLRYHLQGFDPSNHTCSAQVSGSNELVVRVSMDGSTYEDAIPNIGLSNDQVKIKGHKNYIDVHFSKSGYNIRHHLP
ncbi:hypothetical protein ACF0H5_012115 [Mactra antiquata]